MHICAHCGFEQKALTSHCGSCQVFLGSREDRAVFAASLLVYTGILAAGFLTFVLGPGIRGERAIALVKQKEAGMVERIREYTQKNEQEVVGWELGWGTETFPEISLVTFSYASAEDRRKHGAYEAKRSAFWWAVDHRDDSVHAVQTEGEFADRFLLAVTDKIVGVDATDRNRDNTR